MSTSVSSSDSSSSSSAATDALAQLAQLSQTIAQQQALNQDNTVAALSKVTNLGKTVTKSAYSNRATASDIGTLVHGQSRLNAFGQLGAYDKADYLKFTVKAKSSITLGALVGKDVHIQVQDKSGQVVADNDPTAGDTYTAYKNATTGNLSLNSGQYVIKVSRFAGVAIKTKENYGIQVGSGKYGKDYTTTLQAPANTTGIANGVSTGTLAVSLLSNTLLSSTSSS